MYITKSGTVAQRQSTCVVLAAQNDSLCVTIEQSSYIRGILAISILASKITDELVGFREDTLFSF